MMTKEELTKKFFEKDQFAKSLEIGIRSVNEQSAEIGVFVKKEHLNANGCVQGGMLYTVADFAFAVLTNYLHPMTVTQGGHIQYLRPAYTQTLKAVAKETTRNGHNCVGEVILYDDAEEILCVCNFTGFVKETKEK